MFVDKVKLYVQAGKGGDGIVSFRHEKYVAYGGPFGGDGGDGGHVIFEADPGMTTLLDLRYHRRLLAEPGQKGKTKKMHGARGQDLIVKVPLGTLVRRLDNQQIVADLTQAGQQAIIAQGGKGGRGNFHFKSSRNTAPKYAEDGKPGESFDCLVELRVLADVGLVGFPSVGKSTLLDAVSRAHPEIADYPFTTTAPNVGLVQTKDGRSFIMADLPGLIEGASQGKGLGHDFLRHIERCRVIVHVLDMGHDDPIADYRIINQELETYRLRLLERPMLVVANKMDEEGAQEKLALFKQAYPDIRVFETITLLHEGLDALLVEAANQLEKTPVFAMVDDMDESHEGVVYQFKPKRKDLEVVRLDAHTWEVIGTKVERNFHLEQMNDEDDYYILANRLRHMGLDDALREAGCQDGDTVHLAGFQFEFIEND